MDQAEAVMELLGPAAPWGCPCCKTAVQETEGLAGPNFSIVGPSWLLPKLSAPELNEGVHHTVWQTGRDLRAAK